MNLDKIYRCKKCGFEFIAVDDIDTVHEQLTGHKEYEEVAKVSPLTPVRRIVEAGGQIVIPWNPKEDG